MIKELIGLKGPAALFVQPDLYFYTRRMNTAIDVSRDPLALDCSQVFVTSFVETATEYRVFYVGQSAHSVLYVPDGETYENVDQNFLAILPKGNVVHTGWVKQLGSDGLPKPYFQPRGVGFFDLFQVWLRAIIKEGSTLHGYYIAHANNGFYMGYTSSTTDGDTWIRTGTGPFYNDETGVDGDIIFVKAVKAGSTYYIFYNYTDPNVTGIQVASSSSPGTGFTKIHSNLLSNQNLGFLAHVAYINSQFYIWSGREFTTGSGLGPSKKVQLYRTSDFTTFEDLGTQLERKGAMELGAGPEFGLFQKTNGNYFLVHNYGKQSFEFAGFGQEQFTGIKVAELNRSDLPIANKPNIFSYPDYVQRHYPLGQDDYHNGKFYDTIEDDKGEITNTTTGLPVKPVWSALLNFLILDGTQIITFPTVATDPDHFGIKIRIGINLTGTHILARRANDFILSIVSGKLRLQLSSDGITFQKDFITTTNIAKPTGITYVDDHIYGGFTLGPGGLIRLYSRDFEEIDESEITKTVDNALASVNDSLANIVIGPATLELRSVSILIEPTEANFIELDI